MSLSHLPTLLALRGTGSGLYMRCVSLAVALMALGCMSFEAALAQDMPAYWAVTGVSPKDVLHLRDVPSADSKSLAGIPYNAQGLKHLGCRKNEMPFEQWVKLSKPQRQASLMQWCRVEYKGKQGWVAGRYLKPDEATR
jgi:Bacterial SH3 domain